MGSPQVADALTLSVYPQQSQGSQQIQSSKETFREFYQKRSPKDLGTESL